MIRQNGPSGILFLRKGRFKIEEKDFGKIVFQYCVNFSCRRPRQQRKAAIFLNVGQRADPGEEGKWKPTGSDPSIYRIWRGLQPQH